MERNKRKFVTGVYGLEAFGASFICNSGGVQESLWGDADVDLKKAAKLFANKFATGASVTKNASGDDEIVIQGDVADEVHLFLGRSREERS